jgi:two-component system OmpR family sensor kinase
VTRFPIRVRLTLAFAVAMALVLAAIGAFVYDRVGAELLSSVDQTLRLQAAEAASRTHEQRGLVDRDIAAGTTLAEVLDGNGRVVRSSPTLPPLISAADVSRVEAGAAVRRSLELSRPKGTWRLLAIRAQDGPGVVVVARSLEPREETLGHLLDGLVLGGGIGLVLASLLGYSLAAAALRPVEAMRRRAAAITASADAGLPVPRSRDEISRLATTLNDMLSRLHEAFEHERRFLADASHELRTPLALLRAELELALRRPRSAGELTDALRSAAEETERLSRLAEDLLLLARADQGGGLPVRSKQTSAAELLAGAAERFRPRVHARGRDLQVDDTAAQVQADPLRVDQALDNLVANALEHGEGAITLFAIERDDTVELHVADEGQGFSADFAPRAFDRFSRGDKARSRGGAGLGLSIVELIARAHGGAAEARNRAEGGVDAWVALPRAPVRSWPHVPAARSGWRTEPTR